MKQHITVEQLKEVIKTDDETFDIFYKICNRQTPKEWYDMLPDRVKTTEAKTYEKWRVKYITQNLERHIYEISVSITIGRMIEILLGADQCLTITHRIDFHDANVWGYEIQLRHLDYWKWMPGELCDALWEVVKELLNTKIAKEDSYE